MTTYAELKAQADALFQQAEAARREEARAALADIKAKMAMYGLTAEDLGATSTLAQKKPRAEAKYRGPNGQLWSGNGRRPQWVLDLAAKGQSLDECLID